jgi:hypothetical protein
LNIDISLGVVPFGMVVVFFYFLWFGGGLNIIFSLLIKKEIKF